MLTLPQLSPTSQGLYDLQLQNSPAVWLDLDGRRPRHDISSFMNVGLVRLWQGMQRGTSELAPEMHKII